MYEYIYICEATLYVCTIITTTVEILRLLRGKTRETAINLKIG